MADIEVKKSEQPAPVRAWDPFRVMREFMRWDPFTEAGFAPLQAQQFTPAFDVKETAEGYLFRADMPGVKPEDLDVKISQNRLSVSGKREAEKEHKTDTYYTYERSHGSFTRSFTLPEGVADDGVQAELKDGVLTLLVPRRPGAAPKQVTVKKG